MWWSMTGCSATARGETRSWCVRWFSRLRRRRWTTVDSWWLLLLLLFPAGSSISIAGLSWCRLQYIKYAMELIFFVKGNQWWIINVSKIMKGSIRRGGVRAASMVCWIICDHSFIRLEIFKAYCALIANATKVRTFWYLHPAKIFTEMPKHHWRYP